LSWFAKKHGHRIVPIEIGSVSDMETTEKKLTTLRAFVSDNLATRCNRPVWSLQDSLTGPLAYLVPHHGLSNQIPELLQDVESASVLVGEQIPVDVNIWMKSGGARIPLQRDSHNNLLFQIAGANYVRLYCQEESPKLYIRSNNTDGFLAGATSALNCELEDFESHPLARNANYQEVLLASGDSIFIPSNTWFYVRSLSTSINVSYRW
jgi:hypothetical protein